MGMSFCRRQAGGQRQEQLQMSPGMKTVMAGEKATEEEWAGCVKLERETTEGGERQLR